MADLDVAEQKDRRSRQRRDAIAEAEKEGEEEVRAEDDGDQLLLQTYLMHLRASSSLFARPAPFVEDVLLLQPTDAITPTTQQEEAILITTKNDDDEAVKNVETCSPKKRVMKEPPYYTLLHEEEEEEEEEVLLRRVPPRCFQTLMQRIEEMHRAHQYLYTENNLLRIRRAERQQLVDDITRQQLDGVLGRLSVLETQQAAILQSLQAFAVTFQVGR